MNEIFRPSTFRLEEILTGVEVLKCALAGRKASYIAVPITGGARFIAWYTSQGKSLNSTGPDYFNALHVNVIEPNCSTAALRISELRGKLGTLTIDPITLDRPNWSQDDYRHFWGRVIETHVNRAIFLDGWHYSSGCSYEFFVASFLGIPTFSQEMIPIEFEEGLFAIERSVAELNDIGIPTDFQKRVLRKLHDLKSQLSKI